MILMLAIIIMTMIVVVCRKKQEGPVKTITALVIDGINLCLELQLNPNYQPTL